MAANLVIERINTKNCLFLYVYLTSTNEEGGAISTFFRTFAGKLTCHE